MPTFVVIWGKVQYNIALPVRRIKLKQHIANRVHEIADYVIATGATVRQAGKHFAVSKSTVHKDLQQRLKGLNVAKWYKVMAILDGNLAQRHVRGGMATQQKYLKIRNQR